MAEQQSNREQLKYRWKPLESNPDVFNDYIHKLGVSSAIGVTECYGLTPDLMAFVPQPVLAVILTYPYDDAKEAARSDALKELDAPAAPGVYYMKQLVGNACGTIALIHALANAVPDADLGTGTIGDFIRRTRGKGPEEIGNALGEDKKFCEDHYSYASQGQTESTDEAEVDYHFICFVPVNGVLYELDGMHRTVCPISHGKTTPETFFSDAAKIITKNFFEGTDEDSSIAYNIMTLGPL